MVEFSADVATEVWCRWSRLQRSPSARLLRAVLRQSSRKAVVGAALSTLDASAVQPSDVLRLPLLEQKRLNQSGFEVENGIE